MFTFLKYLIQLILAPGWGWKDIEEDAPDAEELVRRGLLPLLGIAAATEFLAFFYYRHVGVGEVLIRAIGVFGGYFISMYIAKLIFELYLGRVTNDTPDDQRTNNLIICGLGLMALIRILSNCLPWNLVLLQFLPLYVVLVLFKACKYLNVKKDSEFHFITICACGIVAVPMAIYYLLYLIIQ